MARAIVVDGNARLGRRAAITLTAVVACVAGLVTPVPLAAADEPTTTLLVLVDPSLPAPEQEAAIADGPGDASSVAAALGLLEVVVGTDDAPAALDAYSADEAVLAVASDLTRHVSGSATDPEYSSQWALPQIGWEDVHGETTYNGEAVLAVLDTGVDASAPDLAGRLGPGWSFDGSDPTIDPNGHGTHVATIAAATSDDGVGIAGVADVNTSIMPVKVLGADGSGSDSDVIAGLMWATDQGADVVVMPFAGPGASAALQAAIDYAWANGVILVAAGGNDGSVEPTYPAGSARVLGVGATEADDSLWPASNRSDGVLISAPGVSVLASDATGVVSVTGTSASAALTAGAAATLRAIDPVASNATIVGRLARNTDPLNGSTLGNGRLDVGEASTDVSEDGITPLGAPGGGPIVGPFSTAVARTWTGASSTNFNNPANWSPAGVPTATDALTIPGAVPSGNYPLVSTATGNGLAASIVIQSGASLTVTGSTLAVSGIVTNNAGGTLTVSNTGTLTVPNNIENNGTFNIFATATVTIPLDYFGTGVGTMTGGTMTIGRNWRPTGGSFTATGGTVRFTGVAAVTSDFASAPNQFFNITVDAGANPRFGSDPGAAIKISNAFTNANPTLNTNFQATFTFNGTGNQTISTASTEATFGNVVVDKPSNRVTMATSAKVSGNVSVASGTLDLGPFQLERATAGGAFSAANGTFLEIGGTGGFPGFAAVNLGPTSTVTYEGTNQSVGAATYGHLVLTGAGTKALPASPTTIAGNFTVAMSANATANASIIVQGNSMFGPTSAFDAGAFTHHARGTFANQSAAWNGGTSTFVLDGGAAQTVTGLVATSFNSLIIDNPAGIALVMGIQIGGTLDFQSGNITTGATAVTIRATGSVTRTSGHVVGNLRKQISTNGTVNRTFEVGTSSHYAPVDLELHGVAGSGSGGVQNLTVTALAGDHPNIATSGVDPSQNANVHWTMTQSGTWTFSDYDATFGFTSGLVDAGADTSAFIVRRRTGSTWFAAAAGTRTPTSTQSLANTSLSDFVVGEASGDATTTGLACPAALEYGEGGVCTATVTTAISGVPPSGTVSFTNDGSGSFSPADSCVLTPQTLSTSSCDVSYTPTSVGTGVHGIEAAFSDGVAYTPSSSSPASIAVSPADLTITADDQTKTYGAFDPVFTFIYTGLVNGDGGAATPPTCTVVGPHTNVSGSPYPITCSGASDPNYTIGYVDGELIVDPADLTITADNQTKEEGGFDPVFTFTYIGLVNGDTATATPPTCTVIGPHDTEAGSPYPITCSGASDDNYTIGYVDGELVVTAVAVPPTVSSITRADTSPTNAAVVHWTVAFSTDVTGVDVTDFSLAGSGAPGASILAVSADTGSTRTVTVVTGSSGALTLNLDDDDSIESLSSTPLGGAGTGSVGSGGTGNGSAGGETYTIDKLGPSITVTTPVEGASYTLGQTVAADYGCTDPSGVATCSGPVAHGASISTTPVGAKTFTVNAADALGNTSSLTRHYSVVFGFSGFFQPVDNLPTLNSLKAGQAVPVKFSLGGNQGLGIFASGYPKSQVIPCDSNALVDGVEETSTAGSSTLTYDAATDRYQYVWKTDKAWAVGTCRQLVLTFTDGTTRHANFKFK